MAEFEVSYKNKIAFVITGIFIGALVTTQFKSSLPSTSYLTDEIEARDAIINSFLNDQSLLKSKIVSLRQNIDENQSKIQKTAKNSNLEILQNLKKEIGLEKQQGAGVIITIADGANVTKSDHSNDELSRYLVNAADLRDIINILRTAKVEAIAINDQRVIASTPITAVGNTILVNNYHLLPPFNITAIGDQELILDRLSDAEALPDLMKRVKENKISYQVDKKSGINIPLYNGDLRNKYMQKAIN